MCSIFPYLRNEEERKDFEERHRPLFIVTDHMYSIRFIELFLVIVQRIIFLFPFHDISLRNLSVYYNLV